MTEQNSTDQEPGPTRRRVITGLATGAGLVAGTVAGATLLSGGPPPPRIEPSQARRFEGKVVLITGATSGIGRSAAIMFAREGAQVGFCGRRSDRGRAVQQEILAAGHEATYIQADVREERDVRRFVDQVADKYGGLDVCFNNAGITIEKPLHEYTTAEWDNVINTDLRGVFLALKYEIPHLIARGGGTVVVTSSSNAIATTEKKSAYSAAKRGLVALVQSAAHDYASQNIRINTLIPGTTNTELVRRLAGAMSLPDPVWERMAAAFGKNSIPGMRRLATPDEIATFALALASDDFPYLTGSQLVIDGGKTAHA